MKKHKKMQIKQFSVRIKSILFKLYQSSSNYFVFFYYNPFLHIYSKSTKSKVKMRIQRKNIKKIWGQGYVTCIPTDDEDLWHIYNLIQKGDHIRMKTSRKIVDQTNVSGLKKIRKRVLVLTLLIVEINYFSKEDRLCISVKGKNAKQNNFLKIGQFHTFQIELETKITIYKEEWPPYEMNLIKQISNQEHGVEIAAMVLEEGVAHLCYVKNSITLLKKKIQKNISKKSSGEEIYKKSLNKFFLECYQIIKTLDFQRIKCFVIASPGFINDQLLRFIKSELEKENDKSKWVDKIILAKCSNGYLNSLNEVLSDPKIMSQMENTKAISQSKVLQEFYNVMKVNQNKVSYGEKEVTRCIQMKAVQKLLISDDLFRSKNFQKRRSINQLYDLVKKYNGDVVVFSSLHPSGEKLKNITGIAAILRFDVVALDEQDNEITENQSNSEAHEDQEFQMPTFNLAKMSLDQEQDEQQVQQYQN